MDQVFIVKTKQPSDYFRGGEFKKKVLLCQSTENLLEFMVSHQFLAE